MKALDILLLVIFLILAIGGNYSLLTDEPTNTVGLVLLNSILAAIVGLYTYKTYIQKK